jgi:hypothetical protein
MKCIDAIEGTVKHVLNRMHAVSLEDKLDDTEYVRNVKAIIDATDQFIRNNPELMENPKLLSDELYRYSRDLWLLNAQSAAPDSTEPKQEPDADTQEYQTYYYDYLYNRGNYPR